MTINEHVNAIYSSVDNMSEKDLKELQKSLSIVLSNINNRLSVQKHLRLHHLAPAESNK